MLRPWQRYFVNETLKSLKDGTKIVAINSPTGSGKTLTALKIVERALEEGLAERAYFAVRTVTQEIPPLRDIERFGVRVNAVPLVGKEKACPLGGSSINLCPQCPWKERLGEPPSSWVKLFEWIRNTIKSFACPYMTLKKLSEKAELVVLTYAYLSPDILNKMNLKLENALLVIDEAHNIFNFMRERRVKLLWAIGVLSQFPKFLKLLSSYEKYRKELEELSSLMPSVQKLLNFLKSLRNYEDVRTIIRIKELADVIPSEVLMISEILDKILPPLVLDSEPPADLGVKIKEVVDSLALIAQGVATPYLDKDVLIIKEVQPWLKRYLENVSGLVMLSGTMPSKDFLEKIFKHEVKYLDLFKEDSLRKSYFSAFKPDNVLAIFVKDYTSKYKLRTDPIMVSRREKVEEACANMILKHGGIGLLVYPSYNALTLSKPHLLELSDKLEVIISERGLGAHVLEKATSLDRALVAVVAGDQVTEGVEMVDERGRSLVKLVAVIGAPFPSPSPFLEDFSRAVSPEDPQSVLDAVFKEEMLVRTKQAIGRLVRRPEDKGIVILADSRFLDYKDELVPFRPKRVLTATELAEIAK